MSSNKTARRAAAAVAAGAALACVATAAPADAAVPHHGKVYFVIGNSNPKETPVVIMHGALNAVGTDPESNSDNFDVLKFEGGTFRIRHPEKDAKYKFYINPKTCFASFTETGTFTIRRGTGKYAGIQGGGSYVGHGSFFLKHKKSGACDDNADATAGIFTVHAHGTLK